MRIADIRTYIVRIPLRPERRMVSALGRHELSEYLLLRIETKEGIHGVGEATVTPRWSGETAQGARALIDRLIAPALKDADPCDIGAILRRMNQLAAHNWFAKSAVEMACWDIAGREASKPVYDLLGGLCRPKTFACRFSLGAYERGRAAEIAAERVAASFRAIKVKVGGDLQQDVARVRAVREAIGPDVQLVIDANCGWDADTAIRAARQLADCNLALFEQPTPDGDYAAMAKVRGSIDPPVMADDTCFNLVHARELIRQQCCDVISVYPGKNGGIAVSREIAKTAADAGVDCTIGSNLEWDVATAAMCHLVVSTPNVKVERWPGDVLGPSYHEFSIVQNPLIIEGPAVTTPDGPGLGIEIDWKTVERHQVV